MMISRAVHEAGIAVAFLSNESYDRTQELNKQLDIEYFEQADEFHRGAQRGEYDLYQAKTSEEEDAVIEVDMLNSDFHARVAELEAERARFESLSESASRMLVAKLIGQQG